MTLLNSLRSFHLIKEQFLMVFNVCSLLSTNGLIPGQSYCGNLSAAMLDLEILLFMKGR